MGKNVGVLLLRRGVMAVCALGVAGMIAGSVATNNGLALTAGLVSAVAVLCLMVATAVAGPPRPVDEAGAAEVEERVGRLVASGADEGEVRALVGTAVRLGRSTQATPASLSRG